MPKSPAFQFYPGDWLSSETVLSMTPAEEGAYIHLLAIAWMTDDCGLPDDDAALAVLSRLGEHWFNGSGTVVRRKFVTNGERLFNERLLEERKKQAERSKLCREAGIYSGKARRSAQLHDERTFNERSTNAERNTNSSFSFSSSKRKEKDSVKKRVSVSFSLPEWMPKNTWETFLAHRRSVRAAVTSKAYPDFVKKFDKLRSAGWEPHLVVETMIEKGWRWFKPEWMERDQQRLTTTSKPTFDPNRWEV